MSPLSTTLSTFFMNDLAKELKELTIGIPFDNDKICILLFVDDILILAEDGSQLQKLFDFVNLKVKVNRYKTKIVYFRNKLFLELNMTLILIKFILQL